MMPMHDCTGRRMRTILSAFQERLQLHPYAARILPSSKSCTVNLLDSYYRQFKLDSLLPILNMEGVGLAPLRTLDDFMLSSARFLLPDLTDRERWSNRIASNLLYYQTNYFLLALLIILLVGLLHPVQMIVGFSAVAAAFAIFVYASNNQYQLRRLKRNHPGLSVAGVIGASYMFIYLFGSVVIFMFGIALPLLAVFIHASLRLRNIKSKIACKVEYIGIRRTPMGVILESFGMDQEAGS